MGRRYRIDYGSLGLADTWDIDFCYRIDWLGVCHHCAVDLGWKRWSA
jgi:hypothetical protein